MRQAIGVVHILISGQTTEHRLPQQRGQQTPGVPAVVAFRGGCTGQVGKSESVVQLPIRQQPGAVGDAPAVALELQVTVDIDPQGNVLRFTRRVVHRAVTEFPSTLWNCAIFPLPPAGEFEVIWEIRIKNSRLPWRAMASCTASTQNSVSSEIDSREARIRRLNQSTTVAR
jgi:hypothetical protein